MKIHLPVAILALFTVFSSEAAELTSCDETALRNAMALGGEVVFANVGG